MKASRRASVRSLTAPLAHAEHFERLLAADLHDSVCQSLAGTSFLVNVLRRQAQAGRPVSADDLKKVAGFLERAMDDLRALISPNSLAERGLGRALEKFAGELSQNIPCRVSVGKGAGVSTPRTALVLYRLARWAIRHAVKSANQVVTELIREGDTLTIKIHDGGSRIFHDFSDDDFDFLRYYAQTAGIHLAIEDGGREWRATAPRG